MKQTFCPNCGYNCPFRTLKGHKKVAGATPRENLIPYGALNRRRDEAGKSLAAAKSPQAFFAGRRTGKIRCRERYHEQH